MIYRISQLIRRRFTQSGTLVLAVIITSGAFGLNTRMALSYQIAVFLLITIFISFISVFIFRSKFVVKRSLPEYATVGQSLYYKIIIQNISQKKHYDLTVFDSLAYQRPDFEEFVSSRDILDKKRNIFDRFVGYPRLIGLIQKKRGANLQKLDIDSINENEIYEGKALINPLRRGYIYFNKIFVTKPDPFGLIRKIKLYLCNDKLLVLPRYYEFPDIKLSGKRKYQHGGMNQASSVGDSEEFFSLRDYRPGDPLRSIHWRSYAKKGTPVIKEYQDEYFSRFGLVLDTFIDNQPDWFFEDAISIATSIIISRNQKEELLDLMFVNNRAYRFTSGRGLASVENILEILACVEPAKNNKFDDLSTLILKHSTETSGLVFVFMDWDEKRKSLIKKIRLRAMPLMIFVISESGEIERIEDDPMMDLPGHFHIFKAGEIEKSLKSISPRHG